MTLAVALVKYNKVIKTAYVKSKRAKNTHNNKQLLIWNQKKNAKKIAVPLKNVDDTRPNFFVIS